MGKIYRSTRLVNWCCFLQTVISDIEVSLPPSNIPFGTFITYRLVWIDFGADFFKVEYETINKRTMLSLPGGHKK